MHPKVVFNEKKENFVSERWKEKQSIKLEFNLTYIILVGSIFVLMIYYIWAINVNATIGFNIRQLELEKNNLLIEKEQLEVKIAKLESLDNIGEDDYANMEKAENPDYLVIREGINYVYNN